MANRGTSIEGHPNCRFFSVYEIPRSNCARARPEGDGPHNAEHVAAIVQKFQNSELTTVTITNRAGEPTRVALAINFNVIIARGVSTKSAAYDRVLTADEIFEIYDLERSDLDPAAGSTLNQGLVGHWSFDGSPLESLRDKSGDEHDVTPEADQGLPEIVESDGGHAVRLGHGNGRLRGRGRLRPR